MKKLPKPTESELSILRILWDHGPCGVRVVAGELSKERRKEVGYTTALKLLQLMHEKGLVERDETERSHRYSAKHSPDAMQRKVVADVADRIFGGSTTRLAMQALSSESVSPEELSELKQLIEKLEQKKGKK